MVNAATDIQYGNEFYKEGTKLPDYLVQEFKIKNPSLLSDHIEVNGKWFEINDIRIKGMVKERKLEFSRLRKHFNIPYVKPKPEVADNSNMLRSKPDKPKVEEPKFKRYVKEDLELLSFSKLRNIGYKFVPRIKERSKKLLIKRILAAQNAR